MVSKINTHNTTKNCPGRFGNQLIRNMYAHILAEKYDLSFEYGDYGKMKSLGIDLYIDGKNDFSEVEPVMLNDDNCFQYIDGTNDLASRNVVFKRDTYVQTREFCLYLNDYFIQNGIFTSIMRQNKHARRYRQNTDLFVHVRLGDATKHNPGLDYYCQAISKITFDQGYISSDTINHPICQTLIKKYGLQIYVNDEVDTLLFASTCKHLVLSHGTYSWSMGFLAPFSFVYYPEIQHKWHGDIFVFDEWKKVSSISDPPPPLDEALCKYVSSRGIMKWCDVYTLQPRSSIRTMANYDFRFLEEGGAVYVCTSAIPHFRAMIDQVHCRFILVTGDCDESCPSDIFSNHDDFLSFIQHPKILHWYSQNCVGKHAKLTQIPIGLDYHTLSVQNHAWGPQASPAQQEKDLETIALNAEPWNLRKPYAYSNFHFSMNTKFAQDRRDALAQVPAGCVFYETSPVPRLASWKKQSEYAFVLSPHGNGLDCHRTWEALVLGCIAIVKTSALDPLFEGLPVWIVKEWSDVNMETMAAVLDEFQDPGRIFSYEKMTMAYWKSRILLKTR